MQITRPTDIALWWARNFIKRDGHLVDCNLQMSDEENINVSCLQKRLGASRKVIAIITRQIYGQN